MGNEELASQKLLYKQLPNRIMQALFFNKLEMKSVPKCLVKTPSSNNLLLDPFTLVKDYQNSSEYSFRVILVVLALVYRIEVQAQISVQVGEFLKIDKRVVARETSYKKLSNVQDLIDVQ